VDPLARRFNWPVKERSEGNEETKTSPKPYLRALPSPDPGTLGPSLPPGRTISTRPNTQLPPLIEIEWGHTAHAGARAAPSFAWAQQPYGSASFKRNPCGAADFTAALVKISLLRFKLNGLCNAPATLWHGHAFALAS
jgi:hypothetical protein